MLAAIRSVLLKECGLDMTRRMLVGVSGGPDSLFLLHVLWKLGAQLLVAHMDHQLRPESEEEAHVVAGLAEQMGYPFILHRAAADELGSQGASSFEAAARNARYRFLFRAAEENDVQAVAVGHTADDQVETVLMHFLRGAGTSGLRGMAYCTPALQWGSAIPLVRPLLGVWRSEIEAYLGEYQLVPLEDASNKDVRYYRNYLRHEVIPFLEEYHAGLRKRIWQTAEVISEDHAALESVVSRIYDSIIVERGEGFILLSNAQFLLQPTGIQRGLVRRAIGALRPGLRDVGFDHIQSVLDFAADPTRSRQRDLTAGLRVFLDEEVLGIADWNAEVPVRQVDMKPWRWLPAGVEQGLELPGETILAEGVTLSINVAGEFADAKAEGLNNTDPFIAWLDADVLQPPLSLRTRLPGDRFQPLGMQGHSMKLADFMINTKMPERVRDTWPLLVSKGGIVWVPGYRIAHPYRISPATRRILTLRFTKTLEIRKGIC